MTQQTALQLVQDECNRLAAKHQIKAYVQTPTEQNEGDEWGKRAFCQIIIDDRVAFPISHEWGQFTNVPHLQQMTEDAFRVVSLQRTMRRQVMLAGMGRR